MNWAIQLPIDGLNPADSSKQSSANYSENSKNTRSINKNNSIQGTFRRVAKRRDIRKLLRQEFLINLLDYTQSLPELVSNGMEGLFPSQLDKI